VNIKVETSRGGWDDTLQSFILKELANHPARQANAVARLLERLVERNVVPLDAVPELIGSPYTLVPAFDEAAVAARRSARKPLNLHYSDCPTMTGGGECRCRYLCHGRDCDCCPDNGWYAEYYRKHPEHQASDAEVTAALTDAERMHKQGW
jgi:hypothetical protein